MLKIAVHAYSSIDPMELQSRMVQLVGNCHGWILDEKPPSLDSYRLRFEVGLEHIADLYGELQQSGLQLTPVAHRALTEMCVCRKHLPVGDEVQIVSVDLRVGTLDEERFRFRRYVRLNPV